MESFERRSVNSACRQPSDRVPSDVPVMHLASPTSDDVVPSIQAQLDELRNRVVVMAAEQTSLKARITMFEAERNATIAPYNSPTSDSLQRSTGADLEEITLGVPQQSSSTTHLVNQELSFCVNPLSGEPSHPSNAASCSSGCQRGQMQASNPRMYSTPVISGYGPSSHRATAHSSQAVPQFSDATAVDGPPATTWSSSLPLCTPARPLSLPDPFQTEIAAAAAAAGAAAPSNVKPSLLQPGSCHDSPVSLISPVGPGTAQCRDHGNAQLRGWCERHAHQDLPKALHGAPGSSGQSLSDTTVTTLPRPSTPVIRIIASGARGQPQQQSPRQPQQQSPGQLQQQPQNQALDTNPAIQNFSTTCQAAIRGRPKRHPGAKLRYQGMRHPQPHPQVQGRPTSRNSVIVPHSSEPTAPLVSPGVPADQAMVSPFAPMSRTPF